MVQTTVYYQGRYFEFRSTIERPLTSIEAAEDDGALLFLQRFSDEYEYSEGCHSNPDWCDEAWCECN
jgi:hypothetical protein